MGGITGWVSYGSDLAGEQKSIDAMTRTLASRGPDEAGTWVRRHVALGHRRLAIIDLPGGTQPMTAGTASGAVALVYSGEVYNFAELRKTLQGRGHRFGTVSDTEVVLYGYLEWGEGVAEHLNGMYAFAIWDERENKLVMIRDRMGIKPLYYYPTPDGTLFGSEPKAILANPRARKDVDTDGLRGLMAIVNTPGWSLWKDMREVEPGTIVTVDSSGIRTRTYWSLPTIPHTDDQATTIEKIRELMTNIVSRQLVADVPSCVLLSGGLDSSAITGLAAAQLTEQDQRLRTFSVDIPNHDETGNSHGPGAADAPYIREMAELVGSIHRNVEFDSVTLADPALRRAVLTARDIPTGFGDANTSLYLLSQAIRDDSTVALSGMAADPLFGGYPLFGNEAARDTDTLTWLVSQSSLANYRIAPLRAEVRDMLDIDSYTADQYATVIAGVEHLEGADQVERRMRTICNQYLTRRLRIRLDHHDRVSMAAGLEVRMPFCDHELVEYVYNAPWSLKTFDGREKSLLRHAAQHVLPPSVTRRAKSGYPNAQDPRYASVLQQQAKEVFAQHDNPVFALVSREWLQDALQADTSTMPRNIRLGIEWVLDLHHWFDIYQPTVLPT